MVRRRPHQFVSTQVYILHVFDFGVYVVLACQVHFLISCMQLSVAVRSPQQQQQQYARCCCLYYIVKKGVWTFRQAKSADVVRMRPPNRTEQTLRSLVSTLHSSQNISHAQHCKKARDGSTLRRLFCAYCMHKVCRVVYNYVLRAACTQAVPVVVLKHCSDYFFCHCLVAKVQS